MAEYDLKNAGMNNTDFRRLLQNPSQKSQSSATSSNTRPTVSLLGNRNRQTAFTPRSVKSAFDQKPRNLKTSVPKGVKLASGYQDRAALARNKIEDDEQEDTPDEREVRINALEEQLKLGQIDRATFENLRDRITGGDISATHLVKGLDRKLLARVRNGENVMANPAAAKEVTQPPPVDLDGELDQLEVKDVAPVQKEVTEKRGIIARPAPVAGQKRSRNDILAELMASRKATTEAKPVPKSTLGAGFRKLGDKRTKEPKIEVDEKGREVLITFDENGRVKRKVRKVAIQSPTVVEADPSGYVNAAPLGMEVPEYARSSTKPLMADEEFEVEDLFADAGSSYNPLAALQEGGSDNDSGSENETRDPEEDMPQRDSGGDQALSSESEGAVASSREDTASGIVSPKEEAPPTRKTNYFKDESTATPEESATASDALKDPTLMAALRLAARRDKKEAEEKAAREAAPSAAAQRLMQRDRDLDDIDMGFGGSRGADGEEDDEGGSRIKLKEWKGIGADEEDEDGEHKSRGGHKQRKRGKKKKGGDKNSAADVMKVVEGRRGKQ